MPGKLSASLEDYLETILILSEDDPEVHASAISDHLRVKRPSVTSALRILKKRELVNYEPYGTISLTAKGKKAAQKVIKRHHCLHNFLVNILLVDSAEAEEAACAIEHALPEHTAQAMSCFMDFLDSKPSRRNRLVKEFSEFLEECLAEDQN